MAIIPGNGRSSSGGGGVQAVFLEAHQSGSANPTNATWLTLDVNPAVFQIANRTNGKAAISFGVTTEVEWNTGSQADVDYQVKLVGHVADTANGNYGTPVDLNVIDGSSLVYRGTRHTTGDTSTHKQLAGYVPFALSDLPSSFTNGKYLRLGLAVKVDSTPSPSRITVQDSYLSFTSFGDGHGTPPDGSIGTSKIGDGSITTAKIANDAVTQAKIAPNSVGASEIITGAVGSSEIADGSITTAKMAAGVIPSQSVPDGSITTAKLAANAVTPAKVSGVTTGSTEAGKSLVLDSTGLNFTTSTITGGGGGGSQTLATITGVLATTKGGTGRNVADFDALRASLGISVPTTDSPMPLCTNADTQKNNTLVRVNTSTAKLPTGVGDGYLIRSGNNQIAVNLSDGKRWVRTITDTNNGAWSIPSDASSNLSSLTSAAELKALVAGTPAILSSSAAAAFRPSYTDGSHPDKVIIGRTVVGGNEYLVATNRQNFWWANRPTIATWTQISWQWEGTTRIPQGLLYSGGETDEEHIPVGDIAVLADKSGIDGEDFIHVLVKHALDDAGTTSTYTGYFLNDNAGETPMMSSNTRGYTPGTWGRTKLDHAGISDDVIAYDTTENEPVFLGIVPGIKSLTFSNYNFRTSGNIAKGDVYWTSSHRQLRVVQKDGDPHLGEIIQSDYEVEIRKDASNYIRGVFESHVVVPLPGGGSVAQAVFRSDDLDVTGTIATGDTVDIIGHKAVYTKTDVIEPIGLGISEGSGEANKFVRLNSSGNAFAANSATIATDDIADDAVTAAKISDGTIDLAKLSNVYSVLDDAYTFQSDTNAGIDDGKFGYVDSGSAGQIAFNVKSADSGAVSQFTVGRMVVLYKDATNYVIGRQTGAATTVVGDDTEGAFTVDEIRREGSFANGDSVKLYYGTASAPGAVVRIDTDGDLTLGHATSETLNLGHTGDIANHVVTVANDGIALSATPSSSVGMMKDTLLMRNNTGTGGNGTTLNVGPTRVTWSNTQNLQTGAWTMSRKAHDWMQVSACGLYYFGHIQAQPIIADLELWVRWRKPGQAWANWVNGAGNTIRAITNTNINGVSAVDLGGDRLQVTKLFSGGSIGTGALTVTGTNPVNNVTFSQARNQAHVDCAVPSGVKTIKLSQLPAAIANGDEVQFTVGFTNQSNSDSPGFTVRNFFLQIDILDGGRVHANY